MAACDPQLSQAEREAGYGQQRTGVVQAVRPFSGPPTIENLIDYVNRELGPAVRANRAKVNEVFKQVADNAPSANPLAYYFSTTTTNADPTTGRMRLNQAVQNTASVVRVSQTNGRQQDVTPWLDVMSGGPTVPLGTLTMVDSINPSRFLRFDLNTMTDQGAYWDLGVTFIESSSASPFVDDEPVVISFIAGVSAAGSTVPVGSLSPVARDTFLGNIGTTTVAPSAVPLANIDSTSIVYDGTAHEMQRAAFTSEVTAAQNVNALTITRSTDFQAAPWTGIHQFNGEVRLGTLHTEASASGALNITLTAGATRVLITSTATVTLGTITGCADGRVLIVEHLRASGSGNLIVTHDASNTTNTVTCPGDTNLIIAGRGGMTLVGRGTSNIAWKVVSVANPDARDGNVDLTSLSGAQGVIDISTLPCGGSVTISSVSAAYSIAGFTAKTNGYWFDLIDRRTSGTTVGTLLEDSGATSTSMRNPEAEEVFFPEGGQARLYYFNTRWRVRPSLSVRGRLLSMTEYTDSSPGTGTHTFSTRARSYLVKIVSAQGGGGGANSAAGEVAVGGQGGWGAEFWIYVTTVPTNVTYTMGGSGTGGANTGADGTGGTATVWDSLTVNAGAGGAGSANATLGSGSGTALGMTAGGSGSAGATGSLPSGGTRVYARAGVSGQPGVRMTGTAGWGGGYQTGVSSGPGLGAFSPNNTDRAGGSGDPARITILEFS